MNGIRAFAAQAIATVVAGCLLGSSAFAQGNDVGRQVNELPWKMSPDMGNIAGKATVPLTGMRFLEPVPTNKFMQLTGNLPRENSYLLGRQDLGWFAVLDFVPDGYVKDDEKIDADHLLSVLKEGNTAAAAERKKRRCPPSSWMAGNCHRSTTPRTSAWSGRLCFIPMAEKRS